MPYVLRTFVQTLDLPWIRGKEDHPVVRQELTAVLVRLLASLVRTGRSYVLGNVADGQSKELSHAAAVMGELLRLSNEDDFNARLEKSKLTQVYADAVDKKEHKHDRGKRQLRAAVWLNPPKTSARTMARREKEDHYPYVAFRQLIHDQLRAPNVIQRLRGEVEAGLPREAVESLGLEPKPQSSSREPQQSSLRPTYVRRPELEAQFRVLVDSGATLIVFHGLPGMGKTWLAQAAAKQLHPAYKEAPVIRVAGGQADIKDVLVTLANFGVELERAMAGDPPSAFGGAPLQ